MARTETAADNYLSRTRTATDWAVWMPKAFFMKWSNPEDWQKNTSDPTIWLPLGFFPPEEREKMVNNYYGNYINIKDIGGDVTGVGVNGTGNVIGKTMVVGQGTINVTESQLQSVSSEYANALKDFSININQRLKGKQIPENLTKQINSSLDDLAKEIEDIKYQEKVSPAKARILNALVTEVVHEVVSALPLGTNVTSTFAPLTQFNSLIGESVEKIVADLVQSE